MGGELARVGDWGPSSDNALLIVPTFCLQGGLELRKCRWGDQHSPIRSHPADPDLVREAVDAG